MVDYASLAQTGLDLLTEFGQDVSFVTDDDGTYDPVTNTFSGGSETPVTVKGALLNYSNKEIDGEFVKRGDAKLIVDAINLTTEPTISDQVSINGVVWSVIAVEPLKPAATIVIYTLQIRK